MGKQRPSELANGDEISAAVVVSAADMRTTFLKLVDPYYLDRSFVRHVQNIKYRGTAARVHFVLDKLPSFTAVANGDAQTLLSGHIQIAPTMTYLQKAFDPVKYGKCLQTSVSRHPDTYLNRSFSGPRRQTYHVCTVKYMPYHLAYRQIGMNDENQSLNW